MKSESALFQELFGSSSIAESLDNTAPVVYPRPLPVIDDPFTEFSSVTGTRSAERIADEQFVRDVSGCDCILGAGTAQPVTSAGIEFLKLVQAANANRGAMNKRASGLTRRDISERMTKYYSHGLWKRWESMMAACIGDATFDEQKALSFLVG